MPSYIIYTFLTFKTKLKYTNPVSRVARDCLHDFLRGLERTKDNFWKKKKRNKITTNYRHSIIVSVLYIIMYTDANYLI